MTLEIGKRYDIFDGPSEEGLFVSLRSKPCPCCGKSWSDRVQLELVLSYASQNMDAKDKRGKFWAQITGVERANSSAEEWHLSGRINGVGEITFKGYYFTKTRRGNIVIS